MTEAFYLRKPYLALPMRGQFEQELNAYWLAKLKYGMNLRRIRSEAIGNFLYRVPDFKEQLSQYRAADNRAIKDKLGELLDDNCALALDYHRRRSH
jgi:UDP:flavonoid glycosyltransferase YjiC (YdhE family)